MKPVSKGELVVIKDRNGILQGGNIGVEASISGGDTSVACKSGKIVMTLRVIFSVSIHQEQKKENYLHQHNFTEPIE